MTKAEDQDVAKPSYAWVRATHPRWWLIGNFFRTGAIAAFVIGLVAFGLAALLSSSPVFGVPYYEIVIAMLGLTFLVEGAREQSAYVLLRCPKCAHNPTRRKDGKRLTRKALWSRLSTMSVCPKCGRL